MRNVLNWFKSNCWFFVPVVGVFYTTSEIINKPTRFKVRFCIIVGIWQGLWMGSFVTSLVKYGKIFTLLIFTSCAFHMEISRPVRNINVTQQYIPNDSLDYLVSHQNFRLPKNN